MMIFTFFFILLSVFYRLLSAMANSVEPDQTAPAETV